MVDVPLRRVFRALWALSAVCLVAGLPALILDFKAANYSVHYQARGLCSYTQYSFARIYVVLPFK